LLQHHISAALGQKATSQAWPDMKEQPTEAALRFINMGKSKLTTEELFTKSSTKSATSASLAKGIPTLLKLKGEVR
jgi:hypothetical protein